MNTITLKNIITKEKDEEILESLTEMKNCHNFHKVIRTKTMYPQPNEEGFLYSINSLSFVKNCYGTTIRYRERIRQLWNNCEEKDAWYCEEFKEEVEEQGENNTALYVNGLTVDFRYCKSKRIAGLKNKTQVLTLDMFFKKRNTIKGIGLYTLKNLTNLFYKSRLINDKTIFELRTCNYAQKGIYDYYDKLGFKKYETVKEFTQMLHHRLKCRFGKFRKINNLT